ncbi:hypothetical protein PGT21_017776 [Puccinia graminis f. sp. tritici]|uniref:Uncharacterized protein n=1 Tax=Puccinia graminis f. sp. tritici TaxID=56615 RepID=A0A5B0PXZ8_PUCGR|nr:hypothetical protein PGT21_017776 [Puccinia graminis f. sp. tritici]
MNEVVELIEELIGDPLPIEDVDECGMVLWKLTAIEVEDQLQIETVDLADPFA